MTRQSWRVILAVVLTVMLISRISAAQQQLAFTSNRSGPSQIYLMNADGSGLVNLSNDSWDDQTPCWSPDGQRIVFSSERQGNWDLYVFDVASGTAAGATRLTTDPGVDMCPTWSPDGQTIAFASNRAGRYAIYAMDSPGGESFQLTAPAADDIQPAYSPDGTMIAFISNETRLGYDPMAGTSYPSVDADKVRLDWGGLMLGVGDVCLVRADGTGRQNLTGATNFMLLNYPSWSPDGLNIVFWAMRPKNGWIADVGVHRWSVSAASSVNLLADLNAPYNVCFPSYSPDGRYIALSGNRGEYGQGRSIWIMTVEGSDRVQVTEDAMYYDEFSPIWRPSPDGGTLARASTWGWVKSTGLGR